nr:YfcO family protein [Escherichia coli]
SVRHISKPISYFKIHPLSGVSRGRFRAYCRAVSELLTFTSYGCDKSTVTVTPTRHPVTDKVLHDIVVNVNTSSGQPIDSTCRFQYVLNEL